MCYEAVLAVFSLQSDSFNQRFYYKRKIHKIGSVLAEGPICSTHYNIFILIIHFFSPLTFFPFFSWWFHTSLFIRKSPDGWDYDFDCQTMELTRRLSPISSFQSRRDKDIECQEKIWHLRGIRRANGIHVCKK